MTYWVALLYCVEFIDLCRFDMHFFVYENTKNIKLNQNFVIRDNNIKKK